MILGAQKIAIYGASGFGREVAWLCESCGLSVACYIDDDHRKHGIELHGIPVLDLESALQRFPGSETVVAVGNPSAREKIAAKLQARGLQLSNLIHPGVQMSRHITVGRGVMICAGSILTTDIVVGDNVQINLNCTIGHDVVMGDHTTLAPGVNVSGWVHFGRSVYVGTGASFVNGTKDAPLIIGDNVVIGAGACVTKSMDHGTWGGCLPGVSRNTASKVEVAEANVVSSAGDSRCNDERFSQWKYPVIEDGKLTRYNWMVQHKENLSLGYKTDIGAFTYINAKNGVSIGDHAQIGSHCAIYSISTIDDKEGPVVLGRNARIGSHTTIMPGVTIGENAVVGAHSFVNRSIPAGAKAAGVPAKVM